MSENFPPSPGNNWKEWADRLYSYLSSRAAIDARNDPRPLLLLHRVASILYRAVTEGIVLYDPTRQVPVISVNSAWRSLGQYSVAEFSYEVAAASAGAALVTGNNKVPLNTFQLEPIWTVLDIATGNFTLLAGNYHIEASAELINPVAANHTYVAYLASSADLTTPIGDAISHTKKVTSSYPIGNSVKLLLGGSFTVPDGGGTYCLVVKTDNGGMLYSAAHGFIGIQNICAKAKIALLGVP